MATAAESGIVSSDIVGYQQVEVINGYSLFTVTFKNIGETESFDLNNLVPQTPAGVDISGDNKVRVYVLDDAGNYGDTIAWYGKTLQGWSKDSGATKIADGEVTVGNGKGFAVYNNLKVNANGVEATKNATASSLVFLVSGKVDLTCQNIAVSGYSVNGNSTPVTIDLGSIVPKTPAGVTLTGDNKVRIYLLDAEGNYGDTIAWYGKTLVGWSKDSGATKIAEGEVTLAPGKGFAIYNNLKVNATGVEATKNATASPVVLQLPIPTSAN